MNVSTQLRIPAPGAEESSVASLFLVPRSSAYTRWIKRALDVVLAVTLLVLLAPLLVLIVVAIALLLGPGNVIYTQERIGRNGRTFTIYKFRSMLRDRRHAASKTSGAVYIGPERRKDHKCPDDPRHRPFGRFLRATSLDELPQLFNIIKGEMSMVGPRPELTAVAKRDGFAYHPRHLTRPGLTGPFQVSPLRSMNRISAGLHLDVAYVAEVRLGRDMRILARTALAPFLRRGS
ncbi:MAG: sugar transferase [Actinomycetia bacterium]|nr:sugar transferase [Actinomycetes bacterium]MCP4227104.1 sugar transferase [Actinomycetes bacterium]MCP5030372.1 sugar transferase [Actinomycetes bacterium]